MKTKDFILHGRLNDAAGTEVKVLVTDLDYFIHAPGGSVIYYTDVDYNAQSSCLKHEITFTDIEL